MNKNKPIITKVFYGEDNKIISLEIKKKVTKIGNSGHVLLPKDLIDKIVEIKYKELVDKEE